MFGLILLKTLGFNNGVILLQSKAGCSLEYIKSTLPQMTNANFMQLTVADHGQTPCNPLHFEIKFQTFYRGFATRTQDLSKIFLLKRVYCFSE